MVQDMNLVRSWARRYYDLGFNPDQTVLDHTGHDWSWAFIVFRDISGFVGYKVGSDASVWGCWTNAGNLGSRWNLIKPYIDKDGYARVLIRKNRKRFCIGVHRLVLLAFHGPCPSGCVARHFPDSDPKNNLPWNLSWSTQKQNILDKNFHGTKLFGENHKMSKLSLFQASEIYRRRLSGENPYSLAREFRVSYYTVYQIAKGETWREALSGSRHAVSEKMG
jgi:hypothetical protein